MNRNVKYSDGTMVGGSGTGTILDGVPGQNASYTGYHWTKAVCETCGTVNSNMSINDYGFGKNVYWLYDCDSKFMQELPEQKTYEYVDSTYHKVTTTGGEYCVTARITPRAVFWNGMTWRKKSFLSLPMAGLPS